MSDVSKIGPKKLVNLPPADMGKLQLSEGRPRMHPLAVLGFLLLRGWLGGAKDARFELILRESRSLQIFLHNLNQSSAGASTIEENLNALSTATRERIHQAELALALDEELDDFASLRIDSTHCASASAYPTDSGTLTKLVSRVCARMQKLNRIDLPALAQDKIDLIEEAGAETRQLNYRICTLTSFKRPAGRESRAGRTRETSTRNSRSSRRTQRRRANARRCHSKA